MDNATVGRILERLAAQEAEITTLRATVRGIGHRQSQGRRPGRPRRLSVLVLAITLALIPATLLANDRFSDVPTSNPHHNNITAIANAGITLGCGGTNYCPNDAVTRDQMASFLARTAGLGSNPPVANALTAQTATNATQLGGQPAASYVRRSQLNAQQFSALTGPLSSASNVIVTTSGGALIIFVSGSGFRTSGLGAGLVSVQVSVDGTSQGLLTAYVTGSLIRADLQSRAFVVTGLAAGSHTINLQSSTADTETDVNDRFYISTIELPFP